MILADFLAHLDSLNVKLWVEDDKLRFSAPKGAMTPDLRDTLAHYKPDIITLLKRPNISPIPSTPRQTDLPLSFAQQRLWFLHQLVPQNPAYNLPTVLHLTGKLNPSLLEQVLNQIVSRHEILCTTFGLSKSGQPVQIINPAFHIFINLDYAKHSTPHELAWQLLKTESHRPFDLETGPLVRGFLVQLNPEEHLLLITMHHIVSDGWSVGILLRELGAVYHALVTAVSPVFPPLPIQYADYACWQRQRLQDGAIENQLVYWRKHLANLPEINLPTDYTRPSVPSFQGHHSPINLSPALSHQLKTLSQNEGVSLFMTLMAAFQVLLYRYTGQTDSVVGTPIANRHHPDIENLVGFFVNTLIIRTNLSGQPAFRDVLHQVREVTLAAYANQDVPFELLVENLQPERDLGKNPLCQVVFALQNTPISALSLPELVVKPLVLDAGTVRFDLECHMWEEEGCLQGIIIYSTDLFTAETIERLGTHFQSLLASIVSNPDQPITQLPLLTTGEYQQLVVAWNQTSTPLPTGYVQEWVEAWATQTPWATAVIPSSQTESSLTYLQLNQQANQVAHYLRRLGVGPDVPVAVCLERTAHMIVALLGILKAGGAYVPLDPAYPAERLVLMLDDLKQGNPDLSVLTHSTLKSKLPIKGVCLLALDEIWGEITAESTDTPKICLDLENLAYIIYTSGSTGRPKGVQIPHRGLQNLVAWHQQAFAVSTADRAAHLSGLGFDASVWELWPYLASGATLHLVDQETRLSPAKLRDWFITHQITQSFAPTPLVAGLLTLPWPKNVALTTLLTGGDRLKTYPSEDLPFELINNYGPTEYSVVTTSGQVPRQPQTDKAPAIGRPIANTRLYILDTHYQTVPVGVYGELCISGAGLARGYLHQPGLTADRFSPDPFNHVPGSRLYRTGDRVRYLPDGRLEFADRLDQQIKIRGFRIELGEIEALVTKYPGVRECIALAIEMNGEKRLVTYFVPNNQSETTDVPQVAAITTHIAQWQKLYDETYLQPATTSDATFNIVGWNSSYTGAPIPAEAMQEWVEYTANRVLSWQPQRVLEIGCGTGLLLFRIAPHCLHYLATDFSPIAVATLKNQLQNHFLPQVTLSVQTADDFAGINRESRFDTVILNSVVQYFPNAAYLLQVVKQAVEVVEANGRIFIGDVRSLPLLPIFHASVEFAHAPSNWTADQLRQRIKARMAQEQELVLDPAFFFALQAHLPQITQVQILLKRGYTHNELTSFRYDVILHIESDTPSITSVPQVDWQQDGLTVEKLQNYLATTLPTALRITRIPNARLQKDNFLWNWLTSHPSDTISDVRKAVATTPLAGIEPEALWRLGESLNYQVAIYTSSLLADCCEVVFARPETAVSPPDPLPPSTPSWEDYATNPLHNHTKRTLLQKVNQYLANQLPDYMQPAALILLDALPLTANGKIDRRVLITNAQAHLSGIHTTIYASPQNQIERQIAAIWQESLGVERVGREDNFFNLGGHSLLLVKVHERLSQTFNKPIPLRDMFKYTTVAALAGYLDGEQHLPDHDSAVHQETTARAAARIASLQQRAGRHSYRHPKG